MLKFESISLSHKDRYKTYYRELPEKSSDYSFINLWSWGDHYKIEIAFDSEFCYLRSDGKMHVPIGNWKDLRYVENFKKYFPQGAHFCYVTEDFVKTFCEYFQDKVAYTEARSEWEYLYEARRLVSLSGKKLQKKKNLLLQFQKKYVYEYQNITEENIELVREMQKKWLQVNALKESSPLQKDRSIYDEDRAILKLLNEWKNLKDLVFGGMILVEGVPIAYTIAEILDSTTLSIHYEKAFSEYKGAYQAINQRFLLEHPEYKIINREQDLGILGLRQAKSSYDPIGFVKKYCLTISKI